MKTETRGVEDLLFERGKLTAEKLSSLKLESINTGRSVEEILLEHGLVSPEDLTTSRAELLGIPYVNLTGRTIAPEVLSLIAEPVARRYELIPFEFDKNENTLSVAFADPLDLQVIEFVEKKN